MGVTLIELVFSLALLAVLAGLAAPGFRSSLRVSAVRSASFELLAGLQQARAVSILQSRPGLLCPADASGSCLPEGVAAPGWRSFLESGAHRETLGGQGLPRGVLLRASRSPIRFWPSSFAASTGTLTICDAQGLAPARAIVVSQAGRARLANVASDACDA
jgi:type IV fimbrial biogenesis protein FimT